MQGEDKCSTCSHPYDPHILISDTFIFIKERKVPYSGYMKCPEPGCKCLSTWSLELPSSDSLEEK